MRSLEQQDREISRDLSGNLFRRVDPSNAVILYAGSYFKKVSIGYYYFTRIGWQLYEIVGESQEGLFSCIFSPPRNLIHNELMLVGTLRFGRQQVGRIRVNRRNGSPFMAFHPTGSSDCLIAESCNDHTRGITLVHSDFGEILKIHRGFNWGARPSITRGYCHVGEFLRPMFASQETASLRVIILAAVSTILSHEQFELLPSNRFQGTVG